MLRVGIIVGSTRPGHRGLAVAQWVLEQAAKRSDAEYELVDILDYNLPLLDEPGPPSQGKYTKEHTIRWSERVARYDGFVFVTPEYNHSVPAALKNAIDFLFNEWRDKAAGVVSYGGAGGVRAAEHLRGILGELSVADVRTQVYLSLFTDFEHFSAFKPDPRQEKSLSNLLDEVVRWSGALKTLRA